MNIKRPSGLFSYNVLNYTDMTRVEIVEAAIEHLNRVKNTNLKILSCYLQDTGTVLVKVAYPKIIPGWDANKQSYRFNHNWFESDSFDKVDVESEYLSGFNCPAEIRDDQEKLSILWIAYWFWQRGKQYNVF